MSADIFVVRALAHEWGAWTLERSFPFAADHCINGTRVALTALDRLGVRGRPVSVNVLIANRQAVQLLDRGVPTAEWPEFAWSVGVHEDNDERDGRWNGHLIAEGDGWTLDVSAQQFHRPGKIHVPEPILVPGVIPADEPAVWTDDRGQLYRLERWPANNAWRTSRGWQLHPGNLAAVDMLLLRLRHRLQLSTPDATL